MLAGEGTQPILMYHLSVHAPGFLPRTDMLPITSLLPTIVHNKHIDITSISFAATGKRTRP